MVASVHGDATKRYRYDELGNRISSWQNGETITHSYNKRNQLIKTQEGEAVKEYRYDGRGNLTDIIENGQLKAKYAFDATNMMVDAFIANKGTAEYTYNGFKNRVKKLETLQDAMPQDPCKEIRYILDMTLPYDNLLMTQGAQNQSFVWGNSLLEATGEEKFYYLQDHLGSPIRLLGEEQNDTPLAYDEFGVPLVGASKALNQPFGFTGYQTDDISGMYYAQARYYEPTLGRFGAEDLIKGIASFPTSLNQYAYCWGNPLNYVDFNGLSPMPSWLERGNEAHQLLQNYLSGIQGVEVERSDVKIPGAGPNGGYGYPDVVYRPPTGGITEIYEIKPATWVGRSEGIAQLNRYLSKIQEPAIPGFTLNPLICGHTEQSVLYPNQTITYFTVPSDPGMIYYQYNKPERKPDTVVVPAPENAPEKSKEKGINWGRVGEVAGGIALAGVCAIGIAVVVADDASIVGVANDFLLGPLGAGFAKGLEMLAY